MISNWIRVEDEMPGNGPVLAVVSRLHDSKRSAIIRAAYVEKFTIEANGDFEGDTDYDEKNDIYYWPEGWYEWNEYEEIHWCVSDPVTHWQYLPEPPKQESGK